MRRNISKERIQTDLNKKENILEDTIKKKAYIDELNSQRLNLYLETLDKNEKQELELAAEKHKVKEIENILKERIQELENLYKFTDGTIKITDLTKKYEEVVNLHKISNNIIDELSEEIEIEKKTRLHLERLLLDKKKELIEFKKVMIKKLQGGSNIMFKAYVVFSLTLIAALFYSNYVSRN